MSESVIKITAIMLKHLLDIKDEPLVALLEKHLENVYASGRLDALEETKKIIKRE